MFRVKDTLHVDASGPGLSAGYEHPTGPADTGHEAGRRADDRFYHREQYGDVEWLEVWTAYTSCNADFCLRPSLLLSRHNGARPVQGVSPRPSLRRGRWPDADARHCPLLASAWASGQARRQIYRCAIRAAPRAGSVCYVEAHCRGHGLGAVPCRCACGNSCCIIVCSLTRIQPSAGAGKEFSDESCGIARVRRTRQIEV
jgi:hypothetical protein